MIFLSSRLSTQLQNIFLRIGTNRFGATCRMTHCMLQQVLYLRRPSSAWPLVFCPAAPGGGGIVCPAVDRFLLLRLRKKKHQIMLPTTKAASTAASAITAVEEESSAECTCDPSQAHGGEYQRKNGGRRIVKTARSICWMTLVW